MLKEAVRMVVTAIVTMLMIYVVQRLSKKYNVPILKDIEL